jgi:hypothetical protein
MRRWIAKINENDDSYGDEILIGVAGGETGFEIVLSNEDDSGVMPGMTEEEARENLEDYYGYYDTFVWLEDTED